ncbi:MAG: hypothetical protein ACOYMN_13735, partial [Roseimicrobium sp.]
MKASSLMRLSCAALCLNLASCVNLWPYGGSDTAQRRGSGYSLDAPPINPNRYMNDDQRPQPGVPEQPALTTSDTQSLPVVDQNAPPTSPDPAAAPLPPPGPVTTPEVSTSVVPPPAPPKTVAAPSYGTPVPGRRGFVYPPDVDAKPENMVDVRDFTPGQKVRDP